MVGGGGGAWESYLQTGKQRTVVRQAKDSQAKLLSVKDSYLLSGKQRTVVRQSKDSQASTQPFHRLAPNIRIDAPKRFHLDAPNNRILCPQPFYNNSPKIRIHAPKSFRIHAFNSACIWKLFIKTFI